MGRLTKYGISLAPSGVITSLLRGTLNLWSYDYTDPSHSLRDKSLQLRNLCDDALAQYTSQLQDELRVLRQKLPQPSRENPYPSLEGLEAVKELERYIREVENLRMRVRTAAIPPAEFVSRGQSENQLFFAELESLDRDLLSALSVVTDETVAEVDTVLKKRADTIRQFTAR